MVNLTDVSKQKIKNLFQTEYNVDLTDKEVVEMGNHLFFLGRAMYRHFERKLKKTTRGGTVVTNEVKGEA